MKADYLSVKLHMVPWTVHVVCGDNQIQVCCDEGLICESVTPTALNCRASCATGGDLESWVLLGDQGVDEKSLIHELVHAMTFMMDNFGIPISYDNDEVLAYGLEYLYGETVEYVRERSKR